MIRFAMILIIGINSTTAASPAMAVELRLTPSRPTVETAVIVALPAGHGLDLRRATVLAEYHPGSQVAERVTVGRMSQDGSLIWYPRQTGLVRLEVRDDKTGRVLARRDLGVGFHQRPVSGLAVLIVAGGILLGGIGIGLRNHLVDCNR